MLTPNMYIICTLLYICMSYICNIVHLKDWYFMVPFLVLPSHALIGQSFPKALDEWGVFLDEAREELCRVNWDGKLF